MKKYRVIVTPEAQSAIRESVLYIYEDSPPAAARWLQCLHAQIDTLEHFPERCPPARERDFLEEDLRQLLFKSHRIVFHVDQPNTTVYVLHVRHAKRRAAGAPEAEEP